MSQRSILVLDSGVGGLSVCQSILAEMPGIQLIYFADDAYFPYGLLDEKTLRQRLRVLVSEMLALHQPDLVVLACNTVSTLVLPELRSAFDVPFVGVVPAIKPAAALTRTGVIGLLATPATVKRPYTDQLILDHASQCEVVRVGSSELVEMAEQRIAGHDIDVQRLQDILKPFQNISLDTVVLGCTHFPLLKTDLSKLLPDVQWVDSGEAIAKRVKSLLYAGSGDSSASSVLVDSSKAKGLLESDETLTHQVYFSKMIPNEEIFSRSLEKLGIKQYILHCFSAKMD